MYTMRGVLLVAVVLVMSFCVTAAPQFAEARPQTCTQSITVSSYWSNGTQFSGMFVELQNQHGQDIRTGFTPATFCVKADRFYLVYSNNWTQETFTTWAFPATSENPLNYSVAAGVNGTLLAIYTPS